MILGKLVRLSLILAVALGVGACGKSEEKIADNMAEAALAKQGIKADIDSANQKVTIQGKDGERMEYSGSGEGIKIPADFPKDVYIYEGATAFSAMKANEGHTLSLSSADPLDKIAAAYKEKMKAAGFEEKTSAQTAGMTMMQYTRGKLNVMVQIASDGGDKTQIMLMVQEDQEQK